MLYIFAHAYTGWTLALVINMLGHGSRWTHREFVKMHTLCVHNVS